MFRKWNLLVSPQVCLVCFGVYDLSSGFDGIFLLSPKGLTELCSSPDSELSSLTGDKLLCSALAGFRRMQSKTHITDFLHVKCNVLC